MKRYAFRGTGLLLALAVAVPALAADKNKAEQATAQDYSSLAQSGPVIGKVTKVNPTDKTLTLEMDVTVLKNGARAVAHAVERQEHLARLEQELLRTVNPVQRARKAQQLAAEVEREQLRQANGAYNPQTQTHHKDFNLETTADAKVRLQDPPPQFDDKGNPKKYTPQELKDLKGDSKLPGYQADWTDLKVGQTVKVTLTRALDRKDDKNKDNKDARDDTRPRASLVLVIKDAPDPDAPAGKKK
jgi:hypothetical protein